jgi:hypothetical protein
MSKSRGLDDVGKPLKGDKTLYFHVQNKCVLWHLSSSKTMGHDLANFKEKPMGLTIGHIKLHHILT